MVDIVQQYDAQIRQQIFLEDHKEWTAREFNGIGVLIAEIVRRILFGVDGDRLAVLTRLEFRKLVTNVDNEVDVVLQRWINERTNQLVQFQNIDAQMRARVLLESLERPDLRTEIRRTINEASERLWASTRRSIVPGAGIEVNRFFPNLANNIKEEIKQALRFGYANNDTITQTKRAVIGTVRLRRRDGLLNKFFNRARSVTSTLLQHTAMLGGASVAALLFRRRLLTDKYVWKSVLDAGTTRICRFRNNLVFTLKQAVYPPAHWACRSKVIFVPVGVSVKTIQNLPSNLYSWIRTQPNRIQNIVLGRRRADELRAGNLTRETIGRFSAPGVKDLIQYQRALDIILGG